MTTAKTDILSHSDYVFQRTRNRLEGLTDDEYLWEPAPDSWNVRQVGDGMHRADYSVWPDPPPVTTIAWRLCHLIGCYGGKRNAEWLVVDSGTPDGEGTSTGSDSGMTNEAAGTAAEALGRLEAAHSTWRAVLGGLAEDRLNDKLGPIAGPYADEDKLAFVLHMLDEFIHHGAELAVLRDLYRATVVRTDEDPLVVALLRADVVAVGEAQSDPGALSRVRDAHPDLVTRAAANGRWAALPLLLDLGFPIGGTGRTPLHHAAGSGNLDAVRLLVEHGAPVDVRDPDFDSTPLGWAEYFNRTGVVDYLKNVPHLSATRTDGA